MKWFTLLMNPIESVYTATASFSLRIIFLQGQNWKQEPREGDCVLCFAKARRGRRATCHIDASQQALTDPLPFLKQVLSRSPAPFFPLPCTASQDAPSYASNPRGCFPLLPALSLCTQLHTVTRGTRTRLLVWEKMHINSWAPVWGSRNLYLFYRWRSSL